MAGAGPGDRRVADVVDIASALSKSLQLMQHYSDRKNAVCADRIVRRYRHHMPAPPPSLRERKRLRTRRDIEVAALRLFARHGFERTTVAQIAAAADVGERTFHLHFASKEDVVLGDIVDEMTSMADTLAQRPAGATVLELFRELGDRRVTRFREHSEQVRARRRIEDESPHVHARAVALREKAEASMLAPEFARDLGLPSDAPQVRLMVAAFSGISAALDGLFEASPDDHAARRVLDDALTALDAMLASLHPTSPPQNSQPSPASPHQSGPPKPDTEAPNSLHSPAVSTRPPVGRDVITPESPDPGLGNNEFGL